MNKDVLKVCHDNTHSTSRIFRSVELIKRNTSAVYNGMTKLQSGYCQDYFDDIDKRLAAIEKAATECREQVDLLYSLFKQLDNGDS
jgi:hypothetical protein